MLDLQCRRENKILYWVPSCAQHHSRPGNFQRGISDGSQSPCTCRAVQRCRMLCPYREVGGQFCTVQIPPSMKYLLPRKMLPKVCVSAHMCTCGMWGVYVCEDVHSVYMCGMYVVSVHRCDYVYVCVCGSGSWVSFRVHRLADSDSLAKPLACFSLPIGKI